MMQIAIDCEQSYTTIFEPEQHRQPADTYEGAPRFNYMHHL